ncbi:hypothetical protein GCL60_02530 [Silvanigrella paludirubra]|uniref:Uncharacterized protein n=1 Tax=Silvanigrella paludirubra TaxID=2499159 RepID=A0A6N6VZU3_9BACT|nr:hypothetical protein [Silvanigrella paludirubra]KAB8040822.1 hypothetical protein GCL60_02530 [Silvanigrella paludirubra]
MKMFKLFLIGASILIPVSCIHSPKVSNSFSGTYYYNKSYASNSTIALQTQGWNASANPQFLNSESHVNDDIIYNYYCSRGSQIKSLKYNITFIVPKVPEGIPLDDALKLRKNYIEEGRSAIRNIFFIISKNNVNENSKKLLDKLNLNMDSSSLIKRISHLINNEINLQSNEKLSFFALSNTNNDDILKHFQNTRGNKKEYGLNRFLFLASNKNNSLYLVLADTSRILYFSSKIFKTIESKDYWKWESTGSDDENVQQYALNDMQHHFYGISNEVKLDTGGESFLPFDIIPSHETNMPIYPLMEYYNTEAAFFMEQYTMLIPAIEQRKYFKKNKQLLGYNYETQELSPSAAIYERDKIWKSYVSAFTNVAEAATQDPGVIFYEVSIDLNLFCKYGQKMSDLVTK